MKWGVRRYQNKDGSLTEKGRKRYAEGIAKKAIEESDPDKFSAMYDNKNLHKEIAGDIKTNLGKSYAKEIQAVKDSKSLVDKYEKAIDKVESEMDSEKSWDLINKMSWEETIKERPDGAEVLRKMIPDGEKFYIDSAWEAYMTKSNDAKFSAEDAKKTMDFWGYFDDDAFINSMNRRQDQLCAKYGADYESWNKAKDQHHKNCEKLTNAIIGDKFANKTMEELNNTKLWDKNELSYYREHYTLKSTLEKSYKYL